MITSLIIERLQHLADKRKNNHLNSNIPQMITNKYDLMNVKKDFMNGKSPLPTNFLDLGVKMA